MECGLSCFPEMWVRTAYGGVHRQRGTLLAIHGYKVTELSKSPVSETYFLWSSFCIVAGKKLEKKITDLAWPGLLHPDWATSNLDGTSLLLHEINTGHRFCNPSRIPPTRESDKSSVARQGPFSNACTIQDSLEEIPRPSEAHSGTQPAI